MARRSIRIIAATLIRLAVMLVFGWGAASPAIAVVPPLIQPTWNELTAQQRAVLAPLHNEWNSLEAYRRKKWIGIAQRYPAMTPEEQVRVQQRMSEWMKLRPDQRKAARDSFKSMKQNTPEKRAEMPQKWQEYSQLPDEEKKRLQAEAAKNATPKPATGKHPVAGPL